MQIAIEKENIEIAKLLLNDKRIDSKLKEEIMTEDIKQKLNYDIKQWIKILIY